MKVSLGLAKEGKHELHASLGQCQTLTLYVSRPPANTCMLFLTFFMRLLGKRSNEKAYNEGKLSLKMKHTKQF